MREDITLPSPQAILDLHAELLTEHGGAPGLRDRGALEAALARPRQLLAYGEEKPTVFDLAAALCVSICRHQHPFVDGNKRAALSALGLTLSLNGFYLDVSEREAANTILAVASGEMDERAFMAWVAENSFELPEIDPLT